MSKLRFAKDYLSYRLKAKTRHGTHSPFVYRLVDKVIYDFSAKKVYHEVEKLHKGVVVDKSTNLARLLYRLVADLQPGNIVKLGSNLDIVTTYLQKAAPDAKIYTGSFENILPEITTLNKLDFVLINGNHQSETALKYFEWCLPKVHEGTLLIFDGIYRNDDMKEAWSQIKSHPKVTVTIDLFWMGLVYFKTGQAKEDFLIKI